jgi:plasmid maintenance system killer protein
MNIYFKSNKHAKLINDHQKLIRKYGKLQADTIQATLKELLAADCLLYMPPSLRPHPLEPKSEGKFALDLKHPYRLIIQASGSFTREDYSTIKEVVVTDIRLDYH